MKSILRNPRFALNTPHGFVGKLYERGFSGAEESGLILPFVMVMAFLQVQKRVFSP